MTTLLTYLNLGEMGPRLNPDNISNRKGRFDV